MNKELKRVVEDIESWVKTHGGIATLTVEEFDKVFRFELDFIYYDEDDEAIKPVFGLIDEIRNAGVEVYAKRSVEATGARSEMLPKYRVYGTYAFYLDYNYDPLKEMIQRVFYDFKKERN